MNFTDLIKSGLYPTTSKALAIRDNSSSDCPFGEWFDIFHFSDCSETRKLVQVGILKNKRGYCVCCYNCALVKENYPVDNWQIDKIYGFSEQSFAIHHFHLLVLKFLKKKLHYSTEKVFTDENI